MLKSQIKTILSITLFSSLCATGLVHATGTDDTEYSNNMNFGATAKVGTLGLGLDLTYGINDKFNARFNINGGSLDAGGDKDEIEYDGTLKLQSIGGLLDYYPMGNAFRISAGIYNNANKIDLDATGANNNAKIGNRNYDLSNAKLNTNVDFKSTAPYLGIGWGNAVDKKSKWSVSTDFGVLFQGSPQAKLTASGNAVDLATNTAVDVGTNTLFQSELAKEEANLNDGDLSKFKVLPVVSIGVNYRF